MFNRFLNSKWIFPIWAISVFILGLLFIGGERLLGDDYCRPVFYTFSVLNLPFYIAVLALWKSRVQHFSREYRFFCRVMIIFNFYTASAIVVYAVFKLLGISIS